MITTVCGPHVGCLTAWTDLLDPTDETLRESWPHELHSAALGHLLEPSQPGERPRPRLENHGSYLFGVLLIPFVVRGTPTVQYHEINLVLNESFLLTVRKTAPCGAVFDLTDLELICRRERSSAGMHAFHLYDEVAERYLKLVDELNAEIEALETAVEEEGALPRVRTQISALRHDLLQIRLTLAPTRDAVRSVIDNRADTEGQALFPRDVEVHFMGVCDKMLRACEGLDLCRDLVAGVRDYHQAQVANEQNEVMKRLTVVASVLLVPSLVVGIYGQNFDTMPEKQWHFGYEWSWVLILISTVLQLAYFKHKGWIDNRKGREDPRGHRRRREL